MSHAFNVIRNEFKEALTGMEKLQDISQGLVTYWLGAAPTRIHDVMGKNGYMECMYLWTVQHESTSAIHYKSVRRVWLKHVNMVVTYYVVTSLFALIIHNILVTYL